MPNGTGFGPPWLLNRVILNDDDVGDSGIDVPPNATLENVIVEMTNNVGEVLGRVTDADGSLVRDCIVVVFAQDPVHWTMLTPHLSVVLVLRRPIPCAPAAGRHYVVALSGVDSRVDGSELLTVVRERATKFSIAAGEKMMIDLRLFPAPIF
jgi:hypothetical protein